MIDTALHEEAISLTRDLVRVDSSNPPGNETPAALVLKRYLEANGLECELVARDPDRANLVARIPGKGTGPSCGCRGGGHVMAETDPIHPLRPFPARYHVFLELDMGANLGYPQPSRGSTRGVGNINT